MRYLYQNKYWEPAKEYNLDKLLYLMIDRPNRITSFNEYVWKNNANQTHRDYDLPSWVDFIIFLRTCSLYWDINHKLHRGDCKPARIKYNGYKQYWINGNLIKSEKSK